jgi:hypothetical protein
VPQAILVSDWLISRKSSPLKSIGTKFPFIGESGFRGEDFLEINLLPLVAMFAIITGSHIFILFLPRDGTLCQIFYLEQYRGVK